MQRLILAHVAGDEAAAEVVAAASSGLDLAPIVMAIGRDTRTFYAGAGALLGLIWSKKAASSAEYSRLVEIGAAAGSGAILIRVDNTPLRDALLALRLIEVQSGASPSEFLSAVRVARSATRFNVPRQEDRPNFNPASVPARGVDGKASYSRMFVSGMARGLASSVAVISLGAGAAVGVQNQALLGSSSLADPLRQDAPRVEHANTTLDVNDSFVGRQAGLVSDQEMARQATVLRESIAHQRVEIFARLDFAEQQLADARARTDGVIARLQAISAEGRFFAAASPSTARVQAPAPVVRQAASPVPTKATASAISLVHQAAASQRRAQGDLVVRLTPAAPQGARLEASRDLLALTRYAVALSESPAHFTYSVNDLDLWSPT